MHACQNMRVVSNFLILTLFLPLSLPSSSPPFSLLLSQWYIQQWLKDPISQPSSLSKYQKIPPVQRHDGPGEGEYGSFKSIEISRAKPYPFPPDYLQFYPLSGKSIPRSGKATMSFPPFAQDRRRFPHIMISVLYEPRATCEDEYSHPHHPLFPFRISLFLHGRE